MILFIKDNYITIITVIYHPVLPQANRFHLSNKNFGIQPTSLTGPDVRDSAETLTFMDATLFVNTRGIEKQVVTLRRPILPSLSYNPAV